MNQHARPGRPARPGLVLALAVADTGNAIPFGLASGLHSNHVNVPEWTLSALYAIAAVSLWARLFGWRGSRSGWGWLLSAASWAASASYAAWLPHAVIRERLGLALIFVGIALVALFVWGGEAQYRKQLVAARRDP